MVVVTVVGTDVVEVDWRVVASVDVVCIVEVVEDVCVVVVGEVTVTVVVVVVGMV